MDSNQLPEIQASLTEIQHMAKMTRTQYGNVSKSGAPTIKFLWISGKNSTISRGFWKAGHRTLHQTARWSPKGLLSHGHELQNHPTRHLGSNQNPCDIPKGIMEQCGPCMNYYKCIKIVGIYWDYNRPL